METTKNKSHEDFRITGNWSNQARKLKEKFSQLTDSDLKFEPGKEQELITRVQNKLNKNREEVISIIKKAQADIP